MRTPADHVIETAKQVDAGLEAMQALRAFQREARAETELSEARRATDAAIAHLKAKAGRALPYQAIADLLGVTRQRVHRRVEMYKQAMEADR